MLNLVTIEEYRSSWGDSFQTEKRYLDNVFAACEPNIEHVGSTSMEIDSRPIVDLAIGVDSLDSVKSVDLKLLAKRMWFRIKRTFEDEIVLAKYTDGTYETKSHYAHVVVINSRRWREMVVFRDKLIKSERLRQEYVSLKRQLAKEYRNDVDGYTNAKKEFVLSVIS